MGHIFISYSRRDQEFVERFVGMMESAGMNVWIDREKIQAGRLWRTQIVQAIDTCDGFVLLLSTNSAASDNVRREIDLAHDSGRNIFVMVLEQVKLPAEIRYQLIGLQHINLQTLGLHKGANQLIETLNEQSTVTEEQPIRQVELVIERVDHGAYDTQRQEQLLGFLSQLTKTPESQFKIANLAAGSVHVFVDMPATAAFELKALALNRDSRLKKFGIKSLRLVGDKKYVNISLGILTTAATIGFLNLLWMSIPSLFPSLFGVVVGKVIVITSAIVVTTAVGGGIAYAVVGPSLNPTPTAMPTDTLTSMPSETATLAPTDTPTLVPTETATPTPTDTPTSMPTDTPIPTSTYTPRPTPFGGGGQKIAFVVDNQIWTMNLDGSGRTQLTFPPDYNNRPDWSPDGEKIVFVSGRDGNPEIYVMNADGSGQTRLTYDDLFSDKPAWSPDGRHIAFSNERQIYVMLSDGSGQTRLTSNGDSDDNPDWSPDSNHIVFESNRDGELSTGGTVRAFEIYVMNADGSEPIRLTYEPTVPDFSPCWSPDGRHIAFVSQRDGNNEIYLMNPDGSGQFNLTRDPITDDEPNWSPDSTMIVYTSRTTGTDDIYIRRRDGTIVSRLTNNNIYDIWPIWQP